MLISIALPLPDGVVGNTQRSVQQLQHHVVSGNIMPADSYNISLQYLGTVSSDELLYIYSILDTLAASQLTLAYSSIASWRGSVVAKIKPNPQLTALHSMLADMLEGQGFGVERRAYRPHVTMATSIKCKLPFGEVSKCIDVFNAPFVCSSVAVYEVQYTDGVPSYTQLYSVPLL